MRALIVASLIAVLLTLFVVTAPDAPHDAPETEVVAVEAECTCADACMHAALAEVPNYGTEARIEGRVLKLPIETAGSTGYAQVRTVIEPIHDNAVIGLRPGTVLKLPYYGTRSSAIIDSNSSLKVEVFSVGARA